MPAGNITDYAEPGGNAAASLVAKTMQQVPTALPPSFNGDPGLFVFNLFTMTGAFFVCVMLMGRQVSKIWHDRFRDYPTNPICVYRTISLLGVAVAGTLFTGAEALYLWSYDPNLPAITARAIMAKRWIDPIAAGFLMLSASLIVVAEPGIEYQLRRSPLPLDLWSRWPTLTRGALVMIFSFAASLAAVCLR